MTEPQRKTSPQPLAMLAAAVVVATFAVAASPAAGDWLVTTDGARLETRGPWKVEGKMVIFTQPNGTLASLRLAEVDLAASTEATAQAAAPAPEPEPEPKREPILVLTDADVRHVRPEAPTAGPALGEEGEEAADQPAERLVVTGWRELDDPEVEGLTFTGELRNRSQEVTGSIVLTVNLYAGDGALLGSEQALLSATTLRPRQTASFRAAFPGTYSYSGAQFEIDSIALLTQSEGEAASEAGELSEED